MGMTLEKSIVNYTDKLHDTGSGDE